MRKIILLLLIALLLPAAVFAHPHMFIDMALKPVLSENGFEGVEVQWLFDMVFTGSVLMDNGIGWKETFTSSEIEIIRDTSFVNLRHYNYFTWFNLEGTMSRPDEYRDFSAFMTDKRLGYRFFLPYTGKNPKAEEVRVAVYDETFFCDIAFREDDPVSLDAPEKLAAAWRISEMQDAPIYYDNMAQTASREGKEYTGQAFPVELIISASKRGN